MNLKYEFVQFGYSDIWHKTQAYTMKIITNISLLLSWAVVKRQTKSLMHFIMKPLLQSCIFGIAFLVYNLQNSSWYSDIQIIPFSAGVMFPKFLDSFYHKLFVFCCDLHESFSVFLTQPSRCFQFCSHSRQFIGHCLKRKTVKINSHS